MESLVNTKQPLSDLFNYADGSIFWKTPRRGVQTKKPAGTKSGVDGKYLQVTIHGERAMVHRIVFEMHHGYQPEFVDHINGDTTDNRIENLRGCSREENCRNAKTPVTNTTGVKNVTYCKQTNKYRVRLWVKGSNKGFGSYEDLELAELVATEARNKFHGEFARHK